MKCISWNINGMRAILRKGELQKLLQEYQPDIICLQETKAHKHQVMVDFDGYVEYWNSAERAGYSGTAIFSRTPAQAAYNNIPAHIASHYQLDDIYGNTNTEGRVLVLEFDTYYIATVYTPNAKADLTRLTVRHAHWDPAFLVYMNELNAKKPVIFCGDFNVAHTENDLANPKQNRGVHGFTDQERQGFDTMAESGFIDTFRMFTQGNGHYTWWSNFANARSRNVGWRIDYWMVSQNLKNKVKKSDILSNVVGSDHCPILLEISL